ncbi:MAG TPA: preprotein translocase subunit SecG [Pelagibacterium sp.]|uniref:preprotein translocase subunit SecG n=1 Tax=Pelagibacterium sp. TaxID=1967288 RepID=UPI002CAFA234|nr:preprotein translocase subunit SecG [Pelagibacterium sp.]HWJ86881.1 preprotein translocase subunit SecG [Pelagibacterium sp.]
MATVLIVAYLLIVIAMIVVILLQRSEGGGLGMGGGGNFMSARGSANLLTRTTSILGTLFMVTAIGLTIVSQADRSSTSILDRAAQNPDGSRSTVLDALDALGGGNDDLAVPSQPAPANDDLQVPEQPAAAGQPDIIEPGASMMSTMGAQPAPDQEPAAPAN